MAENKKVSVPVYNQLGEKVSTVSLKGEVFNVEVNNSAMFDAVNVYRSNMRQATSKTKKRDEVSGGGKKPWRQKGTGRARAGSSRSPIWVGGGVAHGPHPRDYHQKVNKKVRRLALCSALTLKVQEENMLILERFDVQAPKTKVMLDFLTAIDSGKKPLFVLHETNMAVVKSAANIPGAEVMHVDSINVYDLLNHDQLIATPEAVKKLEEVFG